MDDDTIAFFLIFGIIWAVILSLVSAYSGVFEFTKPRAGVILLLSPDLEKKQIILSPLQIKGQFSSGLDYVFYVYNDKSFNQSVSLDWWLEFQMVEEAQYVTFYSSQGKKFTIANQTLLECYVQFSVSSSAPQRISERIEKLNPGVHLEVSASLEE